MTAPPTSADAVARQSLAHGSLGTALLHVEQAHRGTGSWSDVHQALTEIGPLIDGDDANLFLGAPAMAFVLHLAADDSSRYAGARHTLTDIVAVHTRSRLVAAHARIDRGQHPEFREYDLLRGLTGIGALLLRQQPHGREMKGVLEYLVRLTEPVKDAAGRPRPGWWVAHSPATDAHATPGGHANAGLAHGITGPLALLALAKLRGITVAGHDNALRYICRWLDQIREHSHHGVYWPRWITVQGPASASPTPLSWCYGTPGLARAQQLAGLALDDGDRTRMAERALLSSLKNHPAPPHEHGLCHGLGGLLRAVQRVAADSHTPGSFAPHIAALGHQLRASPPPSDNDFLTGATGAELVRQACSAGSAVDWDACLLLI